eukprot:3172441-Pyramimonas_sp.AAC.1
MHKKRCAKAGDYKRHPGHGIDELNSPTRRGELARAARVQEGRLAQVLQLRTAATVEQRVMIGTIRQARALLYCNDNASVADWRKKNEQIWEYWSTGFPAYVKQRHYCRGLNAFVVWSANDIGCASNNQQ